MSLAQQNPTKERVVITADADTVYTPMFRAIVVDVAGTVTIQNTEREGAPITIPVTAGVPIGHSFNKLTAVDGPTVVIGCR